MGDEFYENVFEHLRSLSLRSTQSKALWRSKLCLCVPHVKASLVSAVVKNFKYFHSIFFFNSYLEHRATTSVFNSILSVAILRASYQVLPTWPNSLFTDFLHVSLGLWNPEVQGHIHKGSPIIRILSRINPIIVLLPISLKIHSNIVLPSTHRSP